MGILEKILAQKQSELPALRGARLPSPPSVRPVALRRREGDPLNLICELKHRSPSAGPLSTKLSVPERAAIYEKFGAKMISVLCDETFFGGGYEHLALARQTTQIPLLCKEFIIDEVQLDHAAAYGASAALLIVRCLDPKRLETLIEASRSRGLTPLVEVTSSEEAEVALGSGADHVGVNARDLDTLSMDGARAERVLAELSDKVAAFHFSGVKTQADVARIAKTKTSGALIGEVLMRLDDPSAHLAELAAGTWLF